jgi:hypothetical protein
MLADEAIEFRHQFYVFGFGQLPADMDDENLAAVFLI